MLPKRHNLFAIGSIHSIKCAAYAFVSHPCNVRGVGNVPLTVDDDVKQPAFNFDFGGGGKQWDEGRHFLAYPNVIGLCANVIKCNWLQTKSSALGAIALIMKALKRLVFFDDFIQYATSLRASRGVL